MPLPFIMVVVGLAGLGSALMFPKSTRNVIKEVLSHPFDSIVFELKNGEDGKRELIVKRNGEIKIIDLA